MRHSTWRQFHRKCSRYQSFKHVWKLQSHLLWGPRCDMAFIEPMHRNKPNITSYGDLLNSLGPGDTIWWHKSGSTLARVMACCLTAPSHYLNQCWLIISEVQRHSPGRNFMRDVPTIIRWNELENHLTKSFLKSSRGQWVNILPPVDWNVRSSTNGLNICGTVLWPSLWNQWLSARPW